MIYVDVAGCCCCCHIVDVVRKDGSIHIKFGTPARQARGFVVLRAVTVTAIFSTSMLA